jgi:hypothetical protein
MNGGGTGLSRRGGTAVTVPPGPVVHCTHQ